MTLKSSTCLYPGRCLMPGFHFPSECHTAEMVEQWEAEGAVRVADLEPDRDPFAERCLAHMEWEPCPVCAAYIAAGL